MVLGQKKASSHLIKVSDLPPCMDNVRLLKFYFDILSFKSLIFFSKSFGYSDLNTSAMDWTGQLQNGWNWLKALLGKRFLKTYLKIIPHYRRVE